MLDLILEKRPGFQDLIVERSVDEDGKYIADGNSMAKFYEFIKNAKEEPYRISFQIPVHLVAADLKVLPWANTEHT